MLIATEAVATLERNNETVNQVALKFFSMVERKK